MREGYIEKEYKEGKSSIEIAEELDISARQVQRIIKSLGITRNRSEARLNAVKTGRIKYYKKPEHLKVKRKRLTDAQRLRILIRDRYRCKTCGSTADDGIRLEVDHIDEDLENNEDSNLQTLCNRCNLGKYHNSEKAEKRKEDVRDFYKEPTYDESEFKYEDSTNHPEDPPIPKKPF